MKIVELLVVALAAASCATTVHRGTADTAPLPGHTDRMIVEVTSGEVLGYRSVLKDLQSVRHIYVGERHAVPGYQETQLEVLRLIHRSGTEVGVGIEWLPMESQPIIDAFIARDINEPEFVKRVRWRHMWGHNYEAYSPIFRYARQHNIPIWALGAPHGLARAVGRRGVRGLPPKWRAQLTPLDTKNRAHRQFFEAMMSAVAHAHGGHHQPKPHHRTKKHHHHPKTQPGAHTRVESMMDRYYDAQVLRDEYMAKNLAERLDEKAHSKRVALVFAGVGHTDFALGIPLRAAKILHSPFRIILPVQNGSMEKHASSLRNRPYPQRRADYLWEAPKHRPNLAVSEQRTTR